jgi:hypothetical protein
MVRPFFGKTYVFTQPDGSEIKVRGWGDQHYAVFETLDGYAIVKDPDTGFYCYAELSENKDNLLSTGVKVGLQDPTNLGLQKGIRIRTESAKKKALEARLKTGTKPRYGDRRQPSKIKNTKAKNEN